MARCKLQQNPLEEQINPFEMSCDRKALLSSLDAIDNKSIRTRFKNTKDPINLAFESIEKTSLQKLARDFVKESFTDVISFVSSFVNN